MRFGSFAVMDFEEGGGGCEGSSQGAGAGDEARSACGQDGAEDLCHGGWLRRRDAGWRER